jgi:hypothetical protein
VAARGQRVNGWADGLETLCNRSSMRKLLYDNLRCTVRPGLGLLEQLAEGVLSCPKSEKLLFSDHPPLDRQTSKIIKSRTFDPI